MAKKQKVGGSMMSQLSFGLSFKQYSFYVYSRTTNIPFSDVSHIKVFPVYSFFSSQFQFWIVLYLREHHQLLQTIIKNSKLILFFRSLIYDTFRLIQFRLFPLLFSLDDAQSPEYSCISPSINSKKEEICLFISSMSFFTVL